MAGVTKKANINATARAIDFVSSFQSRFEALQEILSTMRLIAKEPGTQLKAKRASIVLESGLVGEAETVPYSQASVTEAPIGELVLHKFRKGVSAEAITEYGYDTACEMTDRAMINAIQAEIMNGFYGFIKGGLLTRVENTFQMALAMAKGIVLNKWKSMQMDVTDVVAFVNVMDVYAYLGAATINNVETQFGFNYIRNFMGYSVVFLLSDNEMPRGKVVATPVDNVVLYYLNPSNSEFARAGLSYNTVGETPLIGSHIEGNYGTVVSDNNVIYGLGLFAEYIDGIAVVDFGGSLGSATATSAAGTEEGTKITITAPSTLQPDWSYYIKAQASAAPSAPDYGTVVDDSWTQITVDEDGVCDDLTGLTANHKATLLIVNASKQVISASSAITIVNKT